ncbi:MAG: extracellular solute-binding protein [Candidatus Nanopelagicales bacterium]
MMNERRRLVGVGVCGLSLALAACTAGGGDTPEAVQSIDPSASHAPTNIDVWGAFTNREADIVQASLDRLHDEIPWLTATYVPGKNDEDISRAIASGQSPGVVMAQGPDNVAKYCDSGAWRDLSPYIDSSGLDMAATFPESVISYTSYNGIQCSLPLLTDAYGLYYNKQMLTDNGYDAPPKTISELTEMAKALTQRDADGTINVAGFVSTNDLMYETTQLFNGVNWQAQWYDAEGQSAMASDPRWADLLQWDKDLTDWYGYDNLERFFAQYKDHEWDAGNAFEQGKVAMILDGEWRGAFIEDDGSDVDYGTAAFPVPDDQTDSYGMGQIGGTVAGIPRDAENADVAWLVLQYLTTDAQTLNTLAEQLKNVPTTFESLKTTSLRKDEKFQPFMETFENPDSRYKQLTPTGQADVDLFSQFVTQWEKGKVADLQAGLQDVADQINQLATLG